MITTKQKWLLGGLVPLCGAIWLPQVINLSSGGATSSQVSIEGPDEAEMMAAMEPLPGGVPGQGGGAEPMPQAPGAAAAGSVESASPLGGPDAAFQAVIDALGGANAFGASRGLAPSIDAPDGAEPEASGGSSQVNSAMLAFVEANPLRGTITGDSTRLAIFGGHSVQEGGRIPGTAATLLEVTRGGVVIEESGLSLEVELPPLKTRLGAITPTTRRMGAGQGLVGGGSTAGAMPPGAMPQGGGAAAVAMPPEPVNMSPDAATGGL